MKYALTSACGLLAWSLTTPGFGAHAAPEVVEFTAPPKANYQIADSLWFGANLVVEAGHTDNLDLDSGEDDELVYLEPEARTVFVYAPGTNWRAYTELQLDGKAFLDKGVANDDRSEGHAGIKQLYLDVAEIVDDVDLRIGRQRFKDHQTWWFDEDLDMVKLTWKKDAWFVTAAAGREKAFAEDFAHRDTDEKVDFHILMAGHHAGTRDQITLFLIKKDDHDSRRDEDPLYFGLQRIGEIGSDVRYWANGAIMRGHRRDRKIRAYALDGGFSLRLDRTWRPFITAALAYGSGDNDLDDGIDGNFRQTDLEDNEGHTFGRTGINYYGEVTDFELANLWVGTLGLGVRPDARTSAELIYHRYYQADRDNDLFGNDLEAEPDGDSRYLGHELDLVVAHRPSDDIKFSFTLGAFRPSNAFEPTRGTSWLAKFKIAYRF